jgi:hypothetical protein
VEVDHERERLDDADDVGQLDGAVFGQAGGLGCRLRFRDHILAAGE